jgi:clan AA aspartic protease
MSHVWVEARIANPLTSQEVKVVALVDTGATFTVVPSWICEELGLRVVGKKRVETAKGYADLDESFAIVEIEGKQGVTPVLISKEIKDALIGVLTLEALGLTVDPTTGKLKETWILLL